MAESVGLAASLITLLGTAYKLSKSIYGTVDSISAAPTHIRAVSSDAKAMFSVLGTLSSYLNDEDNAMGVLHRVVAADLGDVLTNSISVLKELQILVGEFVKGENTGGQSIGKWKSIRLHFQEAEVKQWREQLVAHKITLSVAIAMANLVNTNSTEMATKRIETEVLELKSMVTGLLIRMNATEELQADRDVIIDNYKSTIRRVARGADSIISEATWDRETSGPSLSVVVSSAGLSEDTEGSYKTARSVATAKPNTDLDGLHKAPGSLHWLLNEETSYGRDTETPVVSQSNTEGSNLKGWPVGESPTAGPHQVFVKGPHQRTHAFTFECTPTIYDILTQVHDRTGVPPDLVSLRVGGRILTPTASSLDIPDGTTIHANLNIVGIGWNPGISDDESFDGVSLDDLPWDVLYRPKRKRRFALYRQRDYSDGSFRTSVEWYDEEELKAQQRSFAFLAEGLRRIIARGDMIKDDTRSLASGLWGSIGGKRSNTITT
ncbi:hypothetical protein ACHAPT_010062 [Fusarium lateritium]